MWWIIAWGWSVLMLIAWYPILANAVLSVVLLFKVKDLKEKAKQKEEEELGRQEKAEEVKNQLKGLFEKFLEKFGSKDN